MSKKSVRVRNSFSKRWAAVISGSLFFVTAAAHAAHHDDRPKFREFRQQNEGIDRNALRKMYHHQFGGGRNEHQSTVNIQPMLPQVSTVNDAVRVNGVTRRIEKRLERQGVINQSIQQVDNNLINVRGGVNLDLSSSQRNITLGSNLFNNVSSVEISVGGETKTVQAGSQVSAAEYIAVKQVLAGGGQKVAISGAGVATGGDVDLSAITGDHDVMRASDLVVPVNVTTYGDFGKRSDFKLLGDLNNAGSIYAYSSQRSVKGGSIHADDIVNQASGSITSEVDLGLFAAGNLTNHGTITSKGSLTLSAGNTLTNTAQVSAKNDVNLNAPTIANSGSVSSEKANINIDGPADAELNVKGLGGTFNAHNAINVRSSDYAGSFNTNITGGDYLSKELNLNSGGGVMTSNVGEVTGAVSQTGTEAHFTASTDNLVIGGVCLTGDPTWKNDAGNITIAGNVSVGENLTLVASGNILSVNNITIRAANAATGFDITMVAGADQVVGGTNSTTVPAGGTAQATSLTGVASLTGGSIQLGNNVNVDARSTGATGSGGNVLIAAFEGGNAGSGRVLIGTGTTTISTGGRSAADSNGNVTIIAGAQNTVAAQIGNINTTGGNTSTGQINIITTQPISSNGGNINYNANGSLAAGGTVIAGPGIGAGANVAFVRNVTTNVDIFVDADTITTQTGSNVTSNFGTINFNSVNGIIGAGVGALVSAPTINLSSQNTDIGAIGTRVRVDANNLFVDAPLGSVYVQDTDEVNLLAATVQGDFNILAQGTLSNSGQIAGDTVTLRSSGGNINALAPIIGVSGVDLRASFNVESTSQITSPVISLRSDLANIGSVTPITLDADDLIVNAPNGNASIIDVNSVNLGGGTSTVFGTLIVDADFGLSSTSNVTANIVNLTATNGVFNLASTITGNTAINLTAGQSIQNVDLSGALVSPSINLTSTFANIGTNAANPLSLDATNVTLKAANGNVWFSDPNSVNVGNGSSIALGDFQVTAGLNLSSTGTISGQDVKLTATSGGLDLDGHVAGSNSITLISNNSILNSSITGGLDNGFGGDVPNLFLTSTAGDIGSFASPLAVDSDNLTFTASAVAAIQDPDSMVVAAASSAGSDILLVAANSFTNIGTISSGASVNIDSNGTVDIQAAITAVDTVDISSDLAMNIDASITSNNFVVLTSSDVLNTTAAITADSSILAESTLAMQIQGTMTAGIDITLTSDTSSIQTFSSLSATGSAILNADTTINTLGSIITTTGDIELTAHGNIQTLSTVAAGNDLVVTTDGGTIQALGNLSAGNNLALNADDSISTNGTVNAFAGEVDILSGNNISLSGAVGAGTDVFIDADGSVNALDTITGLGSVAISGNSLTLNGNITAAGGFVDLFSFTSVNASGNIVASEDVFVFGDTDVSLSNITAGRLLDVFATNNINATGTVLFGGDAFMQADNTITTSVISAAGDVDLNGENGVTTNGTINGDEVFLTSGSGSVQVNDLLTAVTSANITSDSDILNANIVGGIVSPAINLTSFSGDIGATVPNRLNVSTANLTANAPLGDVYINATGDINFADNGTGSSAQGVFDILVNGGNLTSTGTITANSVLINTPNGSIHLGADLTATLGAGLSALQGITNDAGTRVTATNLQLSTGGSIGTDALSPFNINATNLSVLSSSSSFISEFDSVDVLTGTSTNTFSLVAANNITTSGPVSAKDVVLEATTGQLNLNGPTTGTVSISLKSNNDIANANIGGGLTSPQINLTSTAGLIDISTVDFTNVTANAFTTVLISDANSINFGGGSSSAGGQFQVSAGDNITSTGSITSGTEVHLTTGSGAGDHFDLDGSVTGATIRLESHDAIQDANISGGLFGNEIVLIATTGDINITTVDFINVAAQALSGSVNLADTTASMNLGTSFAIDSSATLNFSAFAPLNVTSTRKVTGGATVLINAGGGLLDLDGAVDSPIITLSSDATIDNTSITGGLSTGVNAVGRLNLISGNGNIGASAADPLDFDAVNLQVQSVNGSVWVNDTGALGDNNLNFAGGIVGVSAAANAFVATAVNNITMDASATISGNTVALTATGGSFTLSGPVLGTVSVSLSSPLANILNANLTGGVLAPTQFYNALNVGLVGNALTVVADNVGATATNAIVISDADDLNVLSATGGTTVTFTAGNDLSSTGLVQGANVTMTATAGGLDLDGLTRGTGSITLVSNDSILDTSISGGLTGTGSAPVQNLILNSTAGSIGSTSVDPLDIDAINLKANAPAGDVFVNDDGHLGDNNLVINSASGALGTFRVTAVGNLSSTAPVSADVVFLQAVNGALDLDGAVSGTTSITVSSFSDLLNTSVSGGLTSPLINLSSTNGSINITSIDFTNVTANANNNVTLTDANSMNFGPGSSFAFNGFFTATAANNLTSSGSISANTNTTLEATGGGLTLNGSVSGLTSITLRANNSIVDGSIAGGLFSPSINLVSFNNSINVSSVDFTNVTANAANGSVTLSDSAGSMNFGPAGSLASTAFSAVAPVNLMSTGTIKGASVSLVATAGAFDLDGLVSGSSSISLTSNDDIENTNISGGLDNGAGGAVPQLNLTSTNGNIGDILSFLAISANSLKLTTPNGSALVAANGNVALGGGSSTALNTISIASTASITVNSAATAGSLLVLDSANSINLNASITGTGGVTLISGNQINQSAGIVNGGALIVEFGAAAVTLNTNVDSLITTNSSGKTLTLNEASGITLLSQNIGTLNIVTSGTGDVVTGATISLGTLDVTTFDGNIFINNNLTGSAAINLDTSSNSGVIERTVGTITTPNFTAHAGSGGIGGNGHVLQLTNGAGAMTVDLNATGGGDINANYAGTGTMTLAASTGNSDVTLTALAGGTIATGGNFSGTGALNITASTITNSNTISFDTINIDSLGSGSAIIINGGAGGFFNSVNGTTIDTVEANMTLNGAITFGGAGDATLTVTDLGGPDNFFIVSALANVVGQNRLTVNACDLVLTGSISGNPLVFNCAEDGTIANNNGNGDVNLTGNIVFNGKSFAILAAGNINTVGATLIDLTGTNNGGSLTLIAGFNFTPPTPGQIQNADLYTLSGPSTQGGSINFGTVNILTVGNNGNGGAVTAVASAGGTNDGHIVLGDIDTSGTAISGQVRLIGAGGVTVGDIDTSGGITSGNVTIAAANPTITGTITVQDGLVAGGGSFVIGTATNGNIQVGNITASGRDVTFTGALGVANTISQALGTNILSNKLIVNTGAGTANFDSTSVNILNTTGGGAINIFLQNGNITLDGVSGAGQDVFVAANGTITTSGAGVNVDSLSLDGSNVGNAIVINAATTANDVSLTTTNGGIQLGATVTGTTTVFLDSAAGITQTGGTVSGSAFTVSFVTSPVTLSTNVGSLVTLSSGTLTVNESNDILLGNQAMTDLTVNSATGNITTSSDFLVSNLTLNAAAGTVAISNDLIATGTATLSGFAGLTTPGGGSVTANTAVLSSNATVGVAAANRFQVAANTFRVSGAANAFVQNTIGGAATINNSTATGTLDILTAGDLVGAGNLSAANLVLSTGGIFGLTGNLSGTSSVSLRANGNILNGNFTGTITTPSLTLTSVNGNVGVDTVTPFVVSANTLNISGNALSPTGSVFINSDATTGVNFLASSAGNDLFLSADGSLTVTGDLNATNGDLTVNGITGTMTIGDNVDITAFSSITLFNNTTVKSSKLVLGAGSTLTTNAKIPGLGDIIIALGPSVLPPGGNKVPKNITVVETGGDVSFVGKKTKGFSPVNTFTAQGADILVSNNLRNNLIEVRGGVNVTADPPVPVGTPTYVSYGRGVLPTANTQSMVATDTTSDGMALTATNTASNLLIGSQTALPTDLQLVSLNNAVSGNVAGTISTLATVSENGLTRGGLQDNSYMVTTTPQSMSYDVGVCSDMQLGHQNAITHSECVTLDNGSVLFVAAKDMSIVSPKGVVKLRAGSMALVVADADHLSVYDVNDQHKRSVTVEVGGRSIQLSPGRHVTVTNSRISQFAEINAIEAMMHRNVGSHDLDNNRKAFTTEFSLPCAIEVLKPLKALAQSNNVEAQKIANKMFKTSAVIMQLTSGSNSAPYEFHAKPKTVAINW